MRLFCGLLCLVFWVSPTHADDPVDRLAAAMANRLQVMTEVAHYKWQHGIAVDAPEREASVIAATVDKALTLGLDRHVATRAVTAQMDAAKMLQRSLIASWQTGPTPERDAPDLAQNIRPRINQLTTAFLQALKDAQPLLENCHTPERPAHIDAAIWQTAVSGTVPLRCGASAD
ncbi:gamma subclass chorismate mutase AroQ [Kordiimonas sp.]|uniref:gamma subclass chorismate mutase AroQ n=1 Tax=Kordiimonas sp. TaxID=1970157 RepID=UPI003A95D5EF